MLFPSYFSRISYSTDVLIEETEYLNPSLLNPSLLPARNDVKKGNCDTISQGAGIVLRAQAGS